MKLLIIEDEEELRTAMADFFKANGEMVIVAHSKLRAEDELISHQFDVVVLDIGLPDGNGLDILPSINQSQENTGILIVSAKNSLDDKINGLDLGADDYITKPFHLAELNSRVKAIVRRKVFKGENQLIFNEFKIDLFESQAYVHDNLIPFTKKEYDLLLYFITNKNRVLTKESIAEHLWENSLDFIDNYDFIYTHIKNLRRKIELQGGNDYLKTVHGIGYKYTNQ